MSVAQLAADLASAAAAHLTLEIGTEIVKAARTAKTTSRDQCLEAAYALATGNLPVEVDGGWLIKSRSVQTGTIGKVKIGGISVLKERNQYVLQGEFGIGEYLPEDSIEVEFHVAGGKTYFVNKDANLCTCEGGKIAGKTCWHMVVVEFYVEALRIRNVRSTDTNTHE